MIRFAVLLGMLMMASSTFAAELPKGLVEPYVKVQQALAADSTTGVTDAAKAIEAAAQPLGADATAIVAGAKKLGAAATLDAARDGFGELSTAIVDYATKTKTDLPAHLHLAYCPMNNKPWLQTEKEIKNPYYGAAMLTCGNFKK